LALNASFHPETGFEMGLNWLYLGLFGFVFYHQKYHFKSVKSGDFCIFNLALFRNFHFSRRTGGSPACTSEKSGLIWFDLP